MSGEFRGTRGLFPTFTVAATIVVVALLTAATAPITLAIVAAFAAGVVLATAILRRLGYGPRADGAVDSPGAEEPDSGAPDAAPYGPLNAYLARRHASYVVLTFEQMESLLGFSLPAVARTEIEWWTSQADHDDGHTKMWTGAGRTATPNLLARNVAFTRA